MAVRGALRRAATQQLCQRLCNHRRVRAARAVAFYLAAASEVDVSAAMRRCVQRGQRVYVPGIDGDNLRFVRWQPGTALVRGKYGLLAPAQRRRKRLAQRLDVIVAPLVAFDDCGNRLGQGGGYYDRALAARRQSPLRAPFLIGAAFACQRVGRIEYACWDVAMDTVVHDTLTRFYNGPFRGIRP